MYDLIKPFIVGWFGGLCVILLMYLGAIVTDINSNKINEAIIICEKHSLVNTISYLSFTCNDGATFKYKEK